MLARKPGERGYRLIGGFVNPTDTSPEAARREVKQEAQIGISNPIYMGSFLVDDWLCRNEVDKIVSTLFVTECMYGAFQPDDDIEELGWFRLSRMLDIGDIVDAHRLLLLTLVERFEKQGGRPLGERGSHELPAQNR